MDDAPIPPHIAKLVWTEFSGGTSLAQRDRTCSHRDEFCDAFGGVEEPAGRVGVTVTGMIALGEDVSAALRLAFLALILAGISGLKILEA